MSYKHNPDYFYMTTPLDPSNNLIPMVDIGTPIMYTLTFNDHGQYADVLPSTRLKKFRERYTSHIVTPLTKIFSDFEGSLEISEPLASKGKHFPRLHYHIVGVVKSPVDLYLWSGYFYNRHHMGYHIQIIDNKEMHQHYLKYHRKQRDQWKVTSYTPSYRI